SRQGQAPARQPATPRYVFQDKPEPIQQMPADISPQAQPAAVQPPRWELMRTEDRPPANKPARAQQESERGPGGRHRDWPWPERGKARPPPGRHGEPPRGGPPRSACRPGCSPTWRGPGGTHRDWPWPERGEARPPPERHGEPPRGGPRR